MSEMRSYSLQETTAHKPSWYQKCQDVFFNRLDDYFGGDSNPFVMQVKVLFVESLEYVASTPEVAECSEIKQILAPTPVDSGPLKPESLQPSAMLPGEEQPLLRGHSGEEHLMTSGSEVPESTFFDESGNSQTRFWDKRRGLPLLPQSYGSPRPEPALEVNGNPGVKGESDHQHQAFSLRNEEGEKGRRNMTEERLSGAAEERLSGAAEERLSGAAEERLSGVKEEERISISSSFECDSCGKVFRNQKSLRLHATSIHGPQQWKYDRLKRPTACEICGKMYTGLAGLQTHIKTVHEAKCPCEKCGAMVAPGYAYKHHLNLHQRYPDNKCPHCNYHDQNPLNITNHVRYVHSRGKTICNICGKEVVHIGNHMARHRYATDRPHKCAECGKSYGRKCELDNHMRRHTGERPYKCEKCPKAFYDSGQLRDHMNIHLGLRPYQCDHCGDAFSNSGARYTHIRLKHKSSDVSNLTVGVVQVQ
ncbi:unnamed protein product [Cyprideis torosa]|uniref:Uncharacterized protein n=1 Tax=Cyprideis torosa TaxID=163714 RepID=A0A7R8WMJ3_9CRUS|nr:unnamed protein product [Cyprideis torosa]CAG0905323.1 unnamed protein product [Cyprideis torosa]